MIEKVDSWLKDNHFQMTITNNGLYIKNYIQLLGLEESLVLIKVKNKTISIKGTNLSLKKILQNELLLKGTIKKIEVLDE